MKLRQKCIWSHQHTACEYVNAHSDLLVWNNEFPSDYWFLGKGPTDPAL